MLCLEQAHVNTFLLYIPHPQCNVDICEQILKCCPYQSDVCFPPSYCACLTVEWKRTMRMQGAPTGDRLRRRCGCHGPRGGADLAVACSRRRCFPISSELPLCTRRSYYRGTVHHPPFPQSAADLISARTRPVVEDPLSLVVLK